MTTEESEEFFEGVHTAMLRAQKVAETRAREKGTDFIVAPSSETFRAEKPTLTRVREESEAD